MGMFDYITCKYPLPLGAHNFCADFQTKDTPMQYMDHYEIREDGTLWHEEYDIEDQSDPNAEGIAKFAGCMTRVNKRWVPELMTGELQFYDLNPTEKIEWIEFSAYFIEGKIKELHLLEKREREKPA